MPVCGVNLVTTHLYTLFSVPAASPPSNQLPLGLRQPSAAICEFPSSSSHTHSPFCPPPSTLLSCASRLVSPF
ncbi:hypothetical protein CPAR01_06146 [Colletotrichum paranaense]|uniref:Uncharacterized protein n=5 Tax=Colletotrichum acutatum species complex TaxID=2707335 RepID=A0AAI9YK36_9PEZI|nr:uncharacterized protein CCOS01_13887 [Colletotrichum costaricense]XP_060351886.1 uncharacterized protein CPAR01_06146 [Colletotrichum paranaense]XP_060387185.1 uncharacterized protein CTAM01_02514 [Colletotrichum tamarilloi]XP_060392829.1 uncharacterized protein CABS01_14869 [Colletotrichum abscissum]KAI3552714.1 hypothetical protein CSPX01_00463 [Colletotrichum filicis]KAK1459210.1 hypothetical protein CMEL01_02209 [Colletotrichum melonis]KAK1496337.1 hypothetical protein CCUS01_13364 [Co